MDPSSVQSTLSVEEDEWGGQFSVIHSEDEYLHLGLWWLIDGDLRTVGDTEGFVIPSLVGDSIKPDVPEVNDLKPSPKIGQANKEEEKIYLGPHGAPPSQAKQQELNTTGRKQQFKQKLKEADRKYTGSGRESKVDSLRELVGGRKVNFSI